jgi:hypothetical protein
MGLARPAAGAPMAAPARRAPAARVGVVPGARAGTSVSAARDARDRDEAEARAGGEQGDERSAMHETRLGDSGASLVPPAGCWTNR